MLCLSSLSISRSSSAALETEALRDRSVLVSKHKPDTPLALKCPRYNDAPLFKTNVLRKPKSPVPRGECSPSSRLGIICATFWSAALVTHEVLRFGRKKSYVMLLEHNDERAWCGQELPGPEAPTVPTRGVEAGDFDVAASPEITRAGARRGSQTECSA